MWSLDHREKKEPRTYEFAGFEVGNDRGPGRSQGLMSALAGPELGFNVCPGRAGAGVYEGTTVLYVHLKRLDAQYIPIKSYLKTQHFSVIL